MPLEISEIGIHLAVAQQPGPGIADASPAGAGLTPAQTEEIVQACVRRVLENLRQRETR